MLHISQKKFIRLKLTTRKGCNMLTIEEATCLLELARRIVTESVSDETREEEKVAFQELREKRGIFVCVREFEKSSKRAGKIIISSGYPLPIFPIVEAVKNASLNISIHILRSSLREISEFLKDVVFELTILTVPEKILVEQPIGYPKEIEIGRDGLVVQRNFYTGVILPQVAIEKRWNAIEFLSECCMEAKLPADAWLEKETSVYKFQTNVYVELEPSGKAVKVES